MHMLHALLQDVRFGARVLRKNLPLSAAIVLTFTIGIGLNAGVFTVIDGLLFRPRVSHDPASFVELRVEREDAGVRSPLTLVSLDQYTAFAGTSSLRDVAAWTPVHAFLEGPTGSREVLPLLVSCNFFSTYGPDRPLVGRVLTPQDCETADPPAV